MSALAAAGVGNMISSIAAPVISGAFTLGGIKRQYEYNKQLMEQQNQFNLDMWKLQNEYNSPQAQMQRYQEAGLNPLLIYGQGTSGNASSPPVQNAPSAPNIEKGADAIGKMFNVANLIGTFLDLESKSADVDSKLIANENARDERRARFTFSEQYDFDPNSGRFIERPISDVSISRTLKPFERYLRERYGFHTNEPYHYMMQKYNAYRQLVPLTSIPYKNALLDMQRAFLHPQTVMKTFEMQHQPETYYLDRAKGKNVGGYVYALGHYLGWW